VHYTTFVRSLNSHLRLSLRREVESAGKSFDEALTSVWNLAEAPEGERANKLPVAIDVLGDSLRVYSEALRNLAAFAVSKAEQQPTSVDRSYLAHHA
jgi:hypothetical protein